MTIASNDFPGLRRLLAQALYDGSSMPAIVHKLEAAFDGVYAAKDFSGMHLDVAMYVLEVVTCYTRYKYGLDYLDFIQLSVLLPSLNSCRALGSVSPWYVPDGVSSLGLR